MATAVSKIANKINIEITNKTSLNLLPQAGELKRVINKCPATILAAKRTAKVKGRITFLTISIKTIKGAKGIGLPIGTRCASIFLVDLTQAMSICPNHKGRAIDKVNVKWLEEVKT